MIFRGAEVLPVIYPPNAPYYRELLEADSGGRGGGGGGGRGFDVSKAGDTRVGFVGFPSVGKSTLLTKLTGTHSEAAAYEASISVNGKALVVTLDTWRTGAQSDGYKLFLLFVLSVGQHGVGICGVSCTAQQRRSSVGTPSVVFSVVGHRDHCSR